MLRVYIPSLGRADRVARSPAAQFPDSADIWWVVAQREAMHYLYELERCRVPGNVLVCPLQGNGEHTLPDIRVWIGQHALDDGVEHHVQMDDDIGFLVRISSESWKLRKAEPPDIEQMLDWIDRRLDTHELVSISGREGNNREGVGGPEELERRNTRTMRCLAYQTSVFMRLHHSRMDDLEDFDLCLQILRGGGSNIVSYYWAQGQRMTQEDGGCALYRKHDTHDAACRELARLHPGHVQVVQKKNKGGGEFGERTEVRVGWKTAWMEGQRRGRSL